MFLYLKKLCIFAICSCSLVVAMDDLSAGRVARVVAADLSTPSLVRRAFGSRHTMIEAISDMHLMLEAQLERAEAANASMLKWREYAHRQSLEAARCRGELETCEAKLLRAEWLNARAAKQQAALAKATEDKKVLSCIIRGLRSRVAELEAEVTALRQGVEGAKE